ncbi:hypothetical protein Tco_0762789, partial [Tanacetum coccineum]
LSEIMDPIPGPIPRRPRSMRPNILVTNLPTLSTHGTVVAKIRFKDWDSREDARVRAEGAGLQWNVNPF